MSASTQRLLARIGRWPRRIAALLCLLLAAGSALVPHVPATAGSSPRRLGAELRRGEVAVPVPIASGVASVRPDDQVGVVAPPPDGDTASLAILVADHLRVITLTQPSALAGDAATVVTVATDRAGALQLARYAARPLLMIVDQLP